MKVAVLAGGRGTRLGLERIPKVMVPIGGAPLLERTVKNAVGNGFSEFLFLTGYLGDAIEGHFGNGSRFGASIDYLREDWPLGTAGCLRMARERLTEPFLVLYGDILMDVDLRAFVDFASSKRGAGTLFAHPNDHPSDSDLLEVDRDQRVVAFHPKPHTADVHYPNLVSAAVYVLSPLALDFVSEGESDWGRDVFPRLAKEAPLYAYRSCEYVKDIGTPERLARAERDIANGFLDRLALRTLKPALFLDRDGVINVERGGVHSPEQVALIPGAAEAIRLFNEAGVPVICVTNQPDLAKGIISWDELGAVTGEIDHRLARDGAHLDDIFICPHHPEKGWPGEVAELKGACTCRKPQDGLLRKAARVHHLNLGHSWLVGDRYCDVAAAHAAGAHSVLVRTGHAGDDRDKYTVEPDRTCADLASAAAVILRALG